MCRNILRSPYVCNGCHCIRDCRKPHFYYRANVAYDSYKALLKDSREGILLSRQELYEIDCLLTPLLRQGQSISHIYHTHKDEIPCSIKTLYNYIDQGLFTARNIDLPKKVKYKSRKKKHQSTQIDYTYRKNRTYQDFSEYFKLNPNINVVEMDTVHGSNKKGKVMLTLLFRNCNLMLIYLMPECTQECVANVFKELKQLLGSESFKKLFPVILIDNGPEFKNPDSIELNDNSEQLTKIFFCNPLASWQKAKLEKNHEYIRKFIPKGIQLDKYTQNDMIILQNHINSTTRVSLNGQSPYELAQLLLNKKLFKAANLNKIQADKIILNTTLI